MADRGERMHELVRELYPVCRSITGDGVRRTLARIGELVDLELHEVPSGTPVLDWVVPDEWNIRGAWIRDAAGRTLVDFADSSLHVVSYSIPVRRRIGAAELARHLHSLPDRPDWIPYRTSYYERNWGFCVTERQRRQLAQGEFEVSIDASLEPGHLTYAEAVLPGRSSDEVLVSAHVCHPSLANDNLSGLAISAQLARELAGRERRLTWRFLYAPGTIGALTWLARNREAAGRIRHGVTLVCLGDDSPLCYKRSFQGTAPVDRAFEHVLRRRGGRVVDFGPYGYDERQYNSPGFRLPVGSLMRGRHGEFPEYHTSADCPDFVRADRLEDSLEALLEVAEILEHNARFRNLEPFGEPQLGRRGLYRALGGHSDPGELQMAMLWVLSMSDGSCDLLGIAERSGVPFARVRQAAALLREHGLLAESD
jgi:aminopeptidase-like protein